MDINFKEGLIKRNTMIGDHFVKLNVTELYVFISVVISGALGGCTAAFTNRSNERRLITTLTVLGYTISGVFGSVIMFCTLAVMNTLPEDFYRIIIMSLMTGFTTSLSMAGTNLCFKLVLEKLGIELEVNVLRKRDKK